MNKNHFIKLPLFLTQKNKYLVGLMVFIFGAIIYFLANHNKLFPPVELPMLWIDNVIPFWPYTIWVYLSECVLFVSVYVLTKDMQNVNKYLYSMTALQIVSVIIFVLWPTTFPRHLYPIPEEGLDGLTRLAIFLTRSSDDPSNCLPSLHVSGVYLSSFMFLDEQKKKFPFYFLWATLVAISTITLKQHYFLDVVAGLGVAILFYWLFHKRIGYYPYQPKR